MQKNIKNYNREFFLCKSHGIVGVCCGPPFSCMGMGRWTSGSCFVCYFLLLCLLFFSFMKVSKRKRKKECVRERWKWRIHIPKNFHFWIELNSRHDFEKKRNSNPHTEALHFMHVCCGMRLNVLWSQCDGLRGMSHSTDWSWSLHRMRKKFADLFRICCPLTL